MKCSLGISNFLEENWMAVYETEQESEPVFVFMQQGLIVPGAVLGQGRDDQPRGSYDLLEKEIAEYSVWRAMKWHIWGHLMDSMESEAFQGLCYSFRGWERCSCCRWEPILTPWEMFLWFSRSFFIAFVIIITHNDLPQGTLSLCLKKFKEVNTALSEVGHSRRYLQENVFNRSLCPIKEPGIRTPDKMAILRHQSAILSVIVFHASTPCESCSVMSLTLCDHKDYTVPGILQARILERVAISFSRGMVPTQGSNPGLPHCWWILYQLSCQQSPRILE